jgi:hypothetical protein
MSSQSSTPNTDETSVRVSTAAPFRPQAPSDAVKKGVATVRRRKEERRAERVRDIRAQTADGTLVVRHMTDAQHEVASEDARQTFARNQARKSLRETRQA